MKEKLTVSCEGKPCYDIVLTIGFEELAGAALSVSAPERKICIVTDTNVALLYAEQVKEAFSSAFAQVEVFEFPAGEENKTLANIQTLYAFLIEHHFDRKDMLAALGGGRLMGEICGGKTVGFLSKEPVKRVLCNGEDVTAQVEKKDCLYLLELNGQNAVVEVE